MNPQTLVLIVAALACPLTMGGIMWMMMRQQNSQQMPINIAKAQPTAQRVATLQAEREALDKEIRELEAIQALEERRRQLESKTAPQPEQALP